MDAKLWGEEFNRHNPPKKVDIFMMCVYEFHERDDRPLFHVEHFIDGDYIKYNSNSGFVDGKFCRQTPQAFSHFTFERSGHELIVVDVQGVGDLYTDPQIHTAEGKILSLKADLLKAYIIMIQTKNKPNLFQSKTRLSLLTLGNPKTQLQWRVLDLCFTCYFKQK